MLPPEDWIDAACDRFEDRWRAGRRPWIEGDLDAAPEAVRPPLLRQLLRVELELRREHGEEPTPQDYRPRFPEYTEQVLAALFEDAWGAGRQPRIEDYLGQTPEPDRPVLLRALLRLELTCRIRRGGRPTLQDYRPRFPEHIELINSVLSEVASSPSHAHPPAVVDPPQRPRDGRPIPVDHQASTMTQRPGGDPGPAEDATLSFMVTSPGGGIGPPAGPEEHAQLRAAFQAGDVLLGRYELVRELGRGAMGLVFEGRDKTLGRRVAIKAILPPRPPGDHAGNISEGRGREEAWREEAFVEEARIGAGLEHPAIATVYDFGHHGGNPFTVFEYLPGQTLQELLRVRGRLPLEEVRLIVGSLAQALDFAHAGGVVHRDLKPANIKATAQGQFKVIDLGLATEFRRRDDWRGFFGTPPYAAPEQFAGLACDGRADQFALALIAYEMLTGRRYFEGKGFEELREVHHSPEPLPLPESPDLPESIRAALSQALQKDPERRFATCEAFAVDLGCHLLSVPVPLPQVLREALIDEMSGSWRSHSMGIFREIYKGKHSPHLALTQDALWGFHRDQIMRWPLESIRSIKKVRLTGIKLILETPRKPIRQTFWFSSPGHRRQWYDDLRALKEKVPPSTWGPLEGPRLEPVVLLRQRPTARFQLLGPVEVQGESRWGPEGSRWFAEASLQIRGAMMGADAVVDVREERMPGFRATTRRLSGTAIRSVDQTGRLELGSRWFASQIGKLTLLIFGYLLTSLVSIFIGSCALNLGLANRGPGAHSPHQPTQVLLGVAFLLALSHGWPLVVASLLWLLRWPQLARPVAVTLFGFAVSHLARALGEIIGVASFGPHGLAVYVGKLVPSFWWASPLEDLGFCFAGVFVARRTWRVYQEFRRLIPDISRNLPSTRRIAERLAITGSFVFALWMVGSNWLSGYRAGRHLVIFAHSSHEQEALGQLGEGHRLMASGQLREAEAAFVRAVNGFKKLSALLPSVPEYRLNQAISYSNLGHLKKATGRPTEAEGAYRRAQTLYERLVVDFPGKPDYRRGLAATLRNLSNPPIRMSMATNCQKCGNPATYHLTEFESGEPRELSFCDEHARRYLSPTGKVMLPSSTELPARR